MVTDNKHPNANPHCEDCDGLGLIGLVLCTTCIDVEKPDDLELGVGD